MFQNISWANYGIVILITLVVYYATVGGLYYLNEIKQLFAGKLRLRLKLNPSKRLAPANFSQQEINQLNEEGVTHPRDEELNSLVDKCMNDIKNSLQYAAQSHLAKQEIIYSLQQTVNKYSNILQTRFQTSIISYILVESLNYGSVHLSEEDLNTIWVM